MRNRHPFIFTLTVLTVIIFQACSQAAAFAASEPKQAPDFELTDLSGAVQKLSSHRGSVVVLNFWATWCPECLDEFSSLNAFAERYGSRGVTVLSVSVDKDESTLREFLAGHPVVFPVILDRTGDIFVRKFLIRGLPATVLIDRKGMISATLLGPQEFQSSRFTKRIDALLKQ